MNASRGPVIDEVALVEHLKANPMFRVGLDVFEVTLDCQCPPLCFCLDAMQVKVVQASSLRYLHSTGGAVHETWTG